MGRQRSCTNLWRRYPPNPAETGGASGYISGRFAIRSSDFFSFSDDDFVYTDPEAYSPLTRLAVGPSDLDLLGWSAFNAPQHRSSPGPVHCRYPAIISRKSLKEQIGVLMPRRYCGSCRSPLHTDDGHSECVSCLGKSHADAALAGSDCSHCESISLASLRTHIAFFSESDPAPRTLPFSSSQGPVRKKQRGRGSQRPVESELTPAQIPRASLSLHREISPILFFQPDQRPSASVSDLVSFGGSDDELANDSMSLVASDAEELSGLVTDPAPSGLPAPSAAKAGMDAELFRVLSKAVEELGLEWSPPEEPSRAVRPLNNDHRRSSLKFTTSSRDLGAPLTLSASVLPLHLPSLRLTERRILSHPDSPPSQTILEIRLRGSGLPVNGPTLWGVSGPPYFYEVHGRGSFPSETDGNPHSQLPWRLAHSGPVRGGTTFTQNPHPQPLRAPGAQGQFRQKRTVSQPTNIVPGYSSGLSSHESGDSARTCSGHSETRGHLQEQHRSPTQSVSENAGPFGRSIASVTAGPAPHVPPSTLVETTGSTQRMGVTDACISGWIRPV